MAAGSAAAASRNPLTRELTNEIADSKAIQSARALRRRRLAVYWKVAVSELPSKNAILT